VACVRNLCEAQDAAAATLAVLAQEHGATSRLVIHCEEMWRRLEDTALAAVKRGDLDGALSLLRRGVEVLADAREAARRQELPIEDLATLMQAI
jgi:hypothetical protein